MKWTDNRPTRHRLKHRTGAAVVAGLILLAPACGSDTSSKKTGHAGKEIAFVGPVAVPVWLQAKAGFEEQAKALGMKAQWNAPNAVDIPGTVQTLQNVINSGVDGIATCALDPKAFAEPLRDAKSRNIPVVLVDCDTEDKSQRSAFVGTVGQTFGQKTAERLIQLSGGKPGNIIEMQGQFDAAIQNQIWAGFQAGIKGHSEMKIVAREADNSDVQVAVEKFENLFRSHPDANVVYCIEAGCAGAAATVVKENGKAGKITIIGTDDDKATLDGIRAGVVTYSAAQPFKQMGELSAQRLAALLDGKQVPSITDTGVVFIDKSNVDSPSRS